MADEIEEEQYQDARGDYIETGPSSPTEAVIRTKPKGADTGKPDPATRSSSGTSGNKGNTETDLGGQPKMTKSSRIPKHGKTTKSTESATDKTTSAKLKIAPPCKNPAMTMRKP